MPQGNAHVLPPGLWYQEPSTSSRTKLFLKTLSRVGYTVVAIGAFLAYKSLSPKYTFTNFIGKTMSLGRLTVLDHEPLTVEQIDELKKRNKK